ncbi:D-alanine--D-alanyl carrier protein ligase [Seminavis robusta]|uniref:D-alanine--D-alanyl carrier protein ligase n=1 Tax=Seminavis robusta TaxID=568900 RepID=A0A9N8GZB0_9STRA|nr:D-alanine--D-alanyl carrier protein ligase [Seminavis robusta]|eukprot:Sro1_g000950.1 D-alanine--D-alanyl carrier protein ligase (1834) ;mRNA; r:288651-294311
MVFFSTILKALSHHATETPNKLVLTWVNIKCEEQKKMTVKQVEDESNAVAARLLKLGCKKGDRVMIAYPFGLEFLAGMFGAMKIGVIPCSIYPPNPNQLKTEMPKFRRFAEDAGAKYALSTSSFATAMTAASVLYKTGVKWIGTDKLPIKKRNPNKPKDYETFVGEPGAICFVQYTSGSTGHPKGVMISHNNLVETCKAGVTLTDCLESNDLEVLWVPQYHDMGLVTGFMGAIYSAGPLVMASPLDFIVNPLLWTDMVEKYQATITSAPNFAYALLLKRLEQANRKADWSCVKRAMFGGEPAQKHVVEAVAKTLSVKPEHIYNVYGMAEMVVLITGGPAKADSEGLVCCGEVDSATLKLRIVEEGKEIEEGQVGSIWAQSPRVAAGYYGQSELTTTTFANALHGYDGTWLDTGDLGKIVDGQLYITGRLKDVIIINGKNYYPSDVELSIDDAFGDVIRPGRTTAFQQGEDSIGITVEGRKGFDKSGNEDLAVKIANHVSQFHGLYASEVVVLKLGVTPKTTSGKLKRSEIRQITTAGDWKGASILLHLQRKEVVAPLPKGKRSSFLERSFSMKGVASSEFYLNEDTSSFLERSFSKNGVASSEDTYTGHEMMKETMSVAVVGGGAAGLITALRLAQRNIKVTVFEQNEQIGGHARHTTVFGHERNPAFGMFLGSAWPNLMALAKELGVDPVPMAAVQEVRDVVGMGTGMIPEANPAEIVRFLTEMNFVYKSGTGQSETIGQYMARNGFDHHFVVSYFLGRMISFFAGNSIQQYLDYPLDLIAWYVAAIVTSSADERVLRMRNKEYMAAFEQKLLSLGVEFKMGCSPSIIGRDKGVSISTSTGDDDIMQFDKLVLAVPPNAALQVLGEHCSDYEGALADFECPLETVVYHTDPKWALPSKINGVFANIPDCGLFLPSLDDTIPITSSLPSDTDNKTPIYATHAYSTFNELDFASPIETMTFTHTKVTCKAILLRKSLLRHQGRRSTYFAGGWTRGLMLHEDALASGIKVANSILRQLGEESHPILKRTLAMKQTMKSVDCKLMKNNIDSTIEEIAPSEEQETENTDDHFSSKFDSFISSIFGSDVPVDSLKTWTENGLSSLKSAELRNKVEEEFHVTLPANFEQLYPTPNALSVFLEASKGQSFPKHDVGQREFEWNTSRSKCSKPVLGMLQGLASIVIFLLLLVSLVPPYFLVSWAMDHCDSTTGSECHGPAFWILLPMAFPMLILSFSLVVVFCKYAVIGTYQPRQFETLSWAYLHWWFMDRLMAVWESLVGPFYVETKYIWIFYWLLGADLAWSAKIESYIREFDLVKVGENATIGHPLKCRTFSQSNEECPKMTLRPIVLGNNSKISGMVSPGAIIGGGSKVEKLTVVGEGAELPNDVLAKGIPAYSSGVHHYSEPIQEQEAMLGVFKTVWPLIEAYHFFTLSFLVHTLLNQILPSWRYATILHWILLFPASSLLALLTSMALKWLLIGKRDPSDDYDGSLYRRATNWACDFHFRVACWTLTPFFGQSRLWNIVLILHGLDVDLESGLNNPYFIFYPSNVDFVKIRKSFVATISLDFTNRGDSKIEIINSSVGYNVILHAGVKIVRSVIPPRSDVSDSVYDLNPGEPWKLGLMMDWILPEVVQMLLNLVIFASLIPAYEIGLAATKSSSISITISGIAAAFVLQLFLWLLLSRVVEKALWILPAHAQRSFFGVYINQVWLFREGNWLVFLLYGTPMFAYYARMMGATVEGELWYFGNALYEYDFLHFKGSTIVDSAHVSGHYIDSNGLTIADTCVSGLLHPGCYASAGSVVSAAEHGPWKVFLRSDMGAQDSRKLSADSTSSIVNASDLV